MKILLTGGSGFMGSNMVHYLLNTYPDYQVLNFDKLTYAGNPANLADVKTNPRYRFFKGDLVNPDDITQAITEFQPDAILNYAAETHVDRSILGPRAFVDTNVIGTFNLLEAMRAHKLSRMLHISTDEVFGSISDGAFTETSPFEPNSPYSASKAGGDHLCRAYAVTYDVPVIVSHSCNFYGPYQYPEKFISLAITNLIEGKTVPLYGSGQNVREWIHTSDHCTAVDTLLHKATPGDIYNIGSGQESSNIDTVKLILRLMDLPEDRIEPVADRAGHDFRYAIDHSKLTSQLGWEPQMTFETGLAATVDWYRANEDWWKPIKSGAYQEYYDTQYQERT